MDIAKSVVMTSRSELPRIVNGAFFNTNMHDEMIKYKETFVAR